MGICGDYAYTCIGHEAMMAIDELSVCSHDYRGHTNTSADGVGEECHSCQMVSPGTAQIGNGKKLFYG